jgi:hypothetical protein
MQASDLCKMNQSVAIAVCKIHKEHMHLKKSEIFGSTFVLSVGMAIL